MAPARRRVTTTASWLTGAALAGTGLLTTGATAAWAAPAAADRGTPPATVTVSGRTFEHRLVDQTLLSRLQTGATATSPDAPLPSNVRRVAGANRYATAVEASKALYPDGTVKTSTVVLARGDRFADALSAQTLSRARPTTVPNSDLTLPAPLLLTEPDALPDATRAELARVLVPGGTVDIVGGTTAVSSGVEAALRTYGYVVDRYDGANRYETAAITAASAAEGGRAPGLVVVADGSDAAGGADALAAGTALGSIAGGTALVLTDGTRLPDATNAYLAALPAATEVVAVGGRAAQSVGPVAYSALVYGRTRYETAVLLAQYFYQASAGRSERPSAVCVASGEGFADALSGAGLCGVLGAPLLLTQPTALPVATTSYLSSVSSLLAEGVVLGGPEAVSDPVANQLASYLQAGSGATSQR